MKPTDLAWAAGFIDGEGYITVFRSAARTSVRLSGPSAGRIRKDPVLYQLFMVVCQVNEAPINRLIALFGGTKRRVRRTKSGQNDYWRWRLSSNEALAALELMLPYFVGKAELVAVAISFQRMWAKTSRKTRPMSDVRREFAEAAHLECRRINGLHRRIPQATEGQVFDWPAKLAEVEALTGSGGA